MGNKKKEKELSGIPIKDVDFSLGFTEKNKEHCYKCLNYKPKLVILQQCQVDSIIEKVIHKNNNCENYKKKWWKFWV